MLIRDLFVSDVTRDIPPVVYFHEQSPEKLSAEVSEYIITGGWPEGHPNHRRVPSGIHEEYVRLLNHMTAELARPEGSELPNSWISGFYGSGKSSFAKLLGLALDGVTLPDGRSLAEAWLSRDTSPKSTELREAWRAFREKVEPLAVVFDIGGVARDNEHIHSAAVRQLQRRLGYCAVEPLVADFELRLERDGEWTRFEKVARQELGVPWSDVKNKALAEEEFSRIMGVMFPEKYSDPMSWFTSRGGTHARSESPDDAVAAIRDMLRVRRPGATLFFVIDEVSQYVLANKDRVDRLRVFATALGSTLRGKAWLLALGQQKLDEEADDVLRIWAKDRFPPKLRVHLGATNIRDVVHKRLLQKRPGVESRLRDLFERHRPDLKLYAYGCESITPDDFAEVYPMLPGQIDLILQITSAMRTRSNRAQGDDQAIRGLLQLLGELFRDQKLAEQPVGFLVTLDKVYEVQHTALDSDIQASMARILNQCASEEEELLVRVAKIVALLELIQDLVPTDTKLVAQCLYDRVDRGNQVAAVTEALETLRRRNLLAYSEKQGYKIQSSAGEEWERERRDIGVTRESISEIVKGALEVLLADSDRPRLQGRPFPWAGKYSDGRQADDVSVVDPRDEAAVTVDFRYLPVEERLESHWIKRSDEPSLSDRIVWVSGDIESVDGLARDLCRARSMVKKYKPRRESLNPARKLLLQQEENHTEELDRQARDAVAASWMSGKMYFRARSHSPAEWGSAFASALQAASERLLPDLFHQFTATQVQPAELLQLIDATLSGPSPKFMIGDLGILEQEGGRYVPTCSGVVPHRIQGYIEAEEGVSGAALLAHFARPPYGYTANVVKACVAGLLRAGKVRLQPEGTPEINAIRDVGVRGVFEAERSFRRAAILRAGVDEIGAPTRARICKFFEDRWRTRLDREDHVIADAVAERFPPLAQDLRMVRARLDQLGGYRKTPPVFDRLEDALADCVRHCRETKRAVGCVKRHLDVLRDGVELLQVYLAELTPEAIRAVTRAADVLFHQAAQLRELGAADSRVEAFICGLAEHLNADKPWRDIGAFDEAIEYALASYRAQRQSLLEWQGAQVEAARSRVKVRDGFSTLTADQAYHVLRPLEEASTVTTVEAVAPTLILLKDPFAIALKRAEDQANDALDEILSEGSKPLITRVDLRLHNREVRSEAEIDALIAEIRAQLLQYVRSGSRVRLV